MRKFFPLILAIAIGLGGYFYFNQDELIKSKIDEIFIYVNEDYKSKKPSPFIKLEKENPINIVVDTINSSNNNKSDMDITEPNYVLDVINSKGEKQVFSLWINENTTSAMYQKKNDTNFYIVSKENTNKLNTLIFR